MRRGGTVIGSAALGALLWLLLGLGSFGVAYADLRLGPLIQLVVVPTTPDGTWQRGEPWNILLPLMGALVFGGLLACGYAAATRSWGWNGSPRAPRVILAWFVGILAGVITAAVWDLGAVLAEREPTGLQWVFREHLPDLLASATVGLVWGWLPALLLGRAGRELSRKAALWVVVCSLVVAATASVVLVSGFPVSTRQDRIAAGGTADGLPTATPTPTPTPTPPDRVAPTPVARGADWCADADVSISVSGIQGALGHRAMTLVVVNLSSSACTVDGYPDVAFAGQDGGAVAVPVTHGSSYLAQDPGPTAVSLQPGGSASATLSWGAGAQGEPVSTMLVAPYAGATRANVQSPADITDQSTVSVTAWASAAQ